MNDLPQDLAGALKDAGLAAFFADCTNAHRNEYLKWIAGAKRPETRKARIEKSIKMLSEKRVEEDARARKRG
ncbi:MAG: YdeI/OmpD-associated family protein [Limisphaerales bacterium]